jgi:pSer/pThr/pTyr-binding forkhead associated (FHA) protein
MSYFLKVLSSPEKKIDGVKFELTEGETIIGRITPPAQILLEGVKVSKKHCLVKVTGTFLKISDLKSSNGLFVNGKRVESAPLKEKDRLVIGEYVLEVGTASAESLKMPEAGGKTSAGSASKHEK